MKSKDVKRIEAQERQAEHDALTTQEKLDIVIARRRRGLTSQREFDRLVAKDQKERGK